jgi:AcrR family transcriptional regulator
MRADILQASLRVLRDEGPLRFTTQRVASVAGISVGSLYQYFPNKEAIVFALRSEMVESAWAEAQRILDEPGLSARGKIHRIASVHFLGAARDNAQMGAALRSTELYFPEEAYRTLNKQVLTRFTRFLRETPRRSEQAPLDARFGADLMLTALENIGHSVASRNLSRQALEKWAATASDMVCDQLGLV